MSSSVFVLRAESSGGCGLRQARNERATFSRLKLKTSCRDIQAAPITTPASPQPSYPLHSRSNHGWAHLRHLRCWRRADSHRALYVLGIPRAWETRRREANTDWQTCCLMARARLSTYDEHKIKGIARRESDDMNHRLAHSSSPSRLTHGQPLASASASVSQSSAPHGTETPANNST